MSLPVYEAISFQLILKKGGHSKPWLVLINAKNAIKPYVVKLYKTVDIEARNKMTAEVLGNVMAEDFGLKAPPAAIIEFTPQFRAQLNEECQGILLQIDDRPKFGCEYIEGAILYNPQTDRKTTNEMLDPALIYAFDYFICNRDRNLYKPNLLIKQNEAYLIDHEMGLEIEPETITNFEQQIWDSRYQTHLFHQFLKKTRSGKENLFDEFLLYLEGVNFTKYNSYFDQLEEMGFSTQKELILQFWKSIQMKPTIFANLLKASVQ